MGRRRRSPHPRGTREGDPPRLAGHRVVGPVGFGADGAVWAAQDPAGRDVVISVLPLSPGSATLRRLAAMRHGTHPHLARVRQVVSLDEHRSAVVSDRVDGPTLATVVAARGALVDGELAGVLAGVGSALGHLHERGLIHGDVSPANIIVTPAGDVVLVDLAGRSSRELGTPGFVPPERARGSAAGAAGDVWALARVLVWAGGGAPGSGAPPVLVPALDPSPARRPTARDLASGAPAIAPAVPVRLPPPQLLAQARMRDASAPTQKRPPRRPAERAAVSTGPDRRVPTSAAPGGTRRSAGSRPAQPAATRHRGTEPARARGRWAVAASVAAGALLVAGVFAVAVPRAGEGESSGERRDGVPAVVASAPSHRQGPDAGPGMAREEPATPPAEVPSPAAPAAPDLVVVAELLAGRDTALADRDPAALAATSLADSPVAQEDAALLAGLVDAGAVLEGLHIEVSDLDVVASDGATAVVQVLLAQSSYERVVGGDRRLVEARPASCARLELAVGDAGDWRLVRSRPCP